MRASQTPEGKANVLQDDDRSYDDSLDGYDSDGSDFTLQELEQPILVGYAFGPKKMQTMEFVMAEASKTQLNASVITNRRPTKAENSDGDGPKTTLTSAMLSSRQPKSEAIILTMSGGPSGSGLRNIVRHFRSSCSSIGLDDATSTSASGTVTTCLTSAGLSTTSAPSHAAQHPLRVSFVPLDLDAPLEEQHGGQFDVILHKMTEDILCLSTAASAMDATGQDEEIDNDDNLSQARERIGRLNQYQVNHPQCSLVDHPTNVQVVMSRWEISLLLETSLVGVTSASGWPVSTPKFCRYSGHEESSSCGLCYPLIAKPLTAAGTKKSHCMGIVLNEGGLEAAPSLVGDDCLLQEYVNHNAILFKVYVLGEHMHVFRRPSLPNLPTDMSELNEMKEKYKEFDSQQRPYPTARDFGLEPPPLSSATLPNHEVVKELTREEIAPVVNVLRQAFGLELFGFDILLSNSADGCGNELLVVDVNYFPSYKEVSNFPSLLAKYLTQRAIQARKTGAAMAMGSAVNDGRK